MILKGAEIGRYLARPDPTRPGLLIHGQDAMRVALKRAEAVAALTGPHADEEMRLTRLPGADLKKDPAALLDAAGGSAVSRSSRATSPGFCSSSIPRVRRRI